MVEKLAGSFDDAYGIFDGLSRFVSLDFFVRKVWVLKLVAPPAHNPESVKCGSELAKHRALNRIVPALSGGP